MGFIDWIKGVGNSLKNAGQWAFSNIIKPGFQWGKGFVGGLLGTHEENQNPQNVEDKLNNAGGQSGSILRKLIPIGAKILAPIL